MNILLIFFALPVATIILAAVLEKVLNSPFAVAGVAFAIYLIVTFAVFNVAFLIATIIYTILAFLTALIVRFIKNLLCDNDDDNSNNCLLNTLSTLSANSNVNTVNNNSNNSCGCGCRRRF